MVRLISMLGGNIVGTFRKTDVPLPCIYGIETPEVHLRVLSSRQDEKG